jgi:hypothetical protein
MIPRHVRWFASAFIVLSLAMAAQSPRPSPTPTEAAQKQQDESTPKQSETKPNNQPTKKQLSAINQPTPEVAVRNDRSSVSKARANRRPIGGPWRIPLWLPSSLAPLPFSPIVSGRR